MLGGEEEIGDGPHTFFRKPQDKLYNFLGADSLRNDLGGRKMSNNPKFI